MPSAWEAFIYPGAADNKEGTEETSSHGSDSQTGTRSPTNFKHKKTLESSSTLVGVRLGFCSYIHISGLWNHVLQHVWLPHYHAHAQPGITQLFLCLMHVVHCKRCCWSRFNNPMAESEPGQTPAPSPAAIHKLHSMVLAFPHLRKAIFNHLPKWWNTVNHNWGLEGRGNGREAMHLVKFHHPKYCLDFLDYRKKMQVSDHWWNWLLFFLKAVISPCSNHWGQKTEEN